MIYILPFFLCMYYYRYNIIEFTLRNISTIEIKYQKWLNIKYPQPNYTIYLNNKEINYNNLKYINKFNNTNKFEIKYRYKNKIYSIYSDELNTIKYYVDNIITIIDKEIEKKTPIYKWISAEDEYNNCYLDTIIKSSGPLGDFYKHYNLNINSDSISDIIGKKIILTDYNLDNYIISPSNMISLNK